MRFLIITLSLLAVTSFVTAQNQTEALMNFARQTDEPNWNHRWNYGIDHCNWFGVTCYQGEVVRLNLAGNNLSGEIKNSLSQIKSLKQIYLQNNLLEGEIDEKLFTHVLVLNLSNNLYHGPLPNFQMDDLTITYVDLSNNYFSGKLTMIGQTIQYMNLLSNDISGMDIDWCDGIGKKPCLNYDNMFPYNEYICPSISLGHYNMILVEPEVFGGYSRCNTCSIC